MPPAQEPLRLLRWRSRTQAFVERLDGLELTMLRIPAGRFLMGSPEAELERQAHEGPVHEVSLGEFLMARTPITQAQWRAVSRWQRREEESWGRDPKPERRKLFISHSRQDRKWAERLRTVLRPLERSDGPGVDLWDPSRIEAGYPWMEELQRVLASAKVVLLLVSPEFLASEFVTRSELPALFNAAREEGLRILWVPLRPCFWKEIPEIMQYQAVIPPGRALAEMSEVEQEEALVEIARTLEKVLREDPQLLVPKMNTERDLNPDPSYFQGERPACWRGKATPTSGRWSK